MGFNFDLQVARLAARQHSVFTRAQVLRIGLSDDQIRYRLRTGRWTLLGPGVYAITGATLTWSSRVVAAVLSSGRSAVASHRTAARLWDVLPQATAPVEILVPHGAHCAAAGRIVRTAVALGRRDVRRIGVIPVTAPARTLADLAAVVSGEQLETALDEFVGLGLISVTAVMRYVADRRLDHRRGAGRLRGLLMDRSQGVPQKELERRFLRLIRTYKLPEPSRQRPSGESKIDFAYPEFMIAIEVDGWNSHGTPRALDSDLHRQNALVLRGWTILRFTWKHVTQGPDRVAAEIRAALDRARV